MMNTCKALLFNEETLKEKLELLLSYTRVTFVYFFLIRFLKFRIHSEKVLGFKILFPDYRAFYGMFLEIFVHQEYAFTTKSAEPLIIDCGSNMGMSVLYFKRKYPLARIICFEPQKKMFDYLQKNIVTNQLKNVELHRAVVYNKRGETSLYSNPESASLTGTSVTKRLLEKTDHLMEDTVQSVLLSDFINQPVDFLKMDIEGAELDVIGELSQSSKSRFITGIVLEYHSNRRTNPRNTLGALLTVLERDGFQYVVSSPMRPPFICYRNKSYNILVFAYR